MRSSFKGGSAVASLSHRRANTALPGDGLYVGINIPEVERQKASKALNCDRQSLKPLLLVDVNQRSCPKGRAKIKFGCTKPPLPTGIFGQGL